jgi:hypothetical protein
MKSSWLKKFSVIFLLALLVLVISFFALGAQPENPGLLNAQKHVLHDSKSFLASQSPELNVDYQRGFNLIKYATQMLSDPTPAKAYKIRQ